MKNAWHFVDSIFFALTVFLVGGIALVPSAAMAAAEKPNVVNVVAKEYSYQMPSTIPAGPTLFHLTDNGNQLHHVTLVKLEDGKTLTDFTSLPPGPFPKWAVFMGGPNTPTPKGGQDEDIVDLTPGNYAVICVIPDTDGKPHMMKGMVKALTVTPSKVARTMPASDLTLTLTNYKFTFSKPVTAGQHEIRVINKGTQPHEAVMFRLNKGKKGADIANWVGGGMKGPPPAAPVTGITPESPGKENILPVNLSPGSYALLCFMPDAKDGKPHAMHGMIYDFDVM